MNYTGRESALPLLPPKPVASEWYLKGFADGYRGRRPVILWGRAREQYKKGYSEGLADARRDFAEAIRD